MISYLPEIYPDELVYSWFCRYYVHTGCMTHKAALNDILSNRHDNPSKEFLGHLNPDVLSAIRRMYAIKDVILNNTMYPQYARFIPLEDKKKAIYHMEYDFCDMVERITVIEIMDDGFAVCVKGHIKSSDKAYKKFKMPIKKIKLTLDTKEKEALKKLDDYNKEERKRKQAAKRNSEIELKKEIEMFRALQEKLLEKRILVPVMCDLTNGEMKNLLNNTSKYIPEIGDGLYVKVYAYDRKSDCYMWCFA